jgi:serine/threonine-protein kinase
MNPSQQSNYWIGQLIGERSRYRIVTRLGGGGMGDVFLATDTLLGQQVAVKMLKERLVHETEVKQRFEREALLCAAIQGEHVVEVKDYGITNEGFPFFVMEYLQGQTLGQLLREEKRLSVERTVRIISQVCDGLFKAHSGVVMSHNSAQSSEVVKFVHRDLKPENIFLVNTSLGELVKVLDFGIAKVFSNDAECTNTGLFVGTFQYAAPEQIESRKDLDLRADIYSIGMILYEMLCGTDPFGCLQEGRLGVNWLRSHTSETPRDLRMQPNCEHLSIALENVVLRCLQKSPRDRFESVAELYQSLQNATGFKFEAREIMRALAASAQTNVSASASPDVMVAQQSTPPAIYSFPSNSSRPTRASQFSDDHNLQITEKLEKVLVTYVGPIAKLLVKQARQGDLPFAEVIDSLSQHVPTPQQSQFKVKAQSEMAILLNKLDTTTHPHSPTINRANTSGTGFASLPTSKTTVPIEPDFINRCQQELAQIIGPMSKIVLQKALAQNPSQSQLVDAIAKQIPNQAEQFRKKFG